MTAPALVKAIAGLAEAHRAAKTEVRDAHVLTAPETLTYIAWVLHPGPHLLSLVFLKIDALGITEGGVSRRGAIGATRAPAT